MIDDDECGAVGEMRIGRRNRSTRRKPTPVPFYTPQIPYYSGSNPGRRGGKPATNRLSYGTALHTEFDETPSVYEAWPTTTGGLSFPKLV
jgi:hypothetical protein